MRSQTYSEAIRRAYQGETIGERLFRRLADRSDSQDRKQKLHAIADVEALTRSQLEPIAQRLGVQISEPEVRATIERRERQLADMPWADFIGIAVKDWPPYIAEFEATARMAPEGDAHSVQVLVDHERALVEFVRKEQANTGGSLELLQQFLSAHGR